MYHSFFQILLLLALHRSSSYRTTNNIIAFNNDKYIQEKIFKQELSILRDSAKKIAAKLSIKKYNLKKVELERLEIKVYRVHYQYLGYNRSLTQKLFPERRHYKKEYIRLFCQFIAAVTNFKGSPEYFIERERQRINNIFKSRYKNTVDEFIRGSGMRIYYQELIDYVNNLHVENDRFFMEMWCNRVNESTRRFDSLPDFVEYIQEAKERAEEMVYN